MDGFIWRFAIVLAVMYALLYFPTNPIAIWLNLGQINITLWALDFFIESGIRDGIDIWINPRYKLYVSQECNGLVPTLALWAAIVAYRGSLLQKLFWVCIVYIVYSIANVLRLALVVYVTRSGEGQKEFFWIHDIVGNIWLGAVGLFMFWLYLRRAKSS